MTDDPKASYRIKDLAQQERPRERLAHTGPGALSTAELLAILLRVGREGVSAVQLGQQILNEFGGLNGMQKATIAQLCQVKGLGPAKAAQVKAAVELGRRMTLETRDVNGAISSPADAAALVIYEMQGLVQEEMRVILLDTRNHLVGIDKVYKGSLNSSMVRVGELFRAAIQGNAASVILVHNHPSGDPTPSPEDAALTRAAVNAGKLLDIEVLDHLVIGQAEFTSMKDKGLGFA